MNLNEQRQRDLMDVFNDRWQATHQPIKSSPIKKVDNLIKPVGERQVKMVNELNNKQNIQNLVNNFKKNN